MSTSTMQISYAPSSEVLFQLFHNEAPVGERPYFPHAHSEFEVTIFISGRGVYTVDRKRQYHVSPGDVLIFRSNEEHWLGSIEPGDSVQTIGVHFQPQIVFAQESNLFDIKYLRAFMSDSPDFNNLIPHDDPVASEIMYLMEQIKLESEKQLQDYELMVKVKLLTILVEINRYTGLTDDQNTPHIPRLQLLQITKGMQYIRDHFTEDLRIDDIAKELNMSTSYFSHTFKAVNRISPIEYIISNRIEMAKAELQNTDDAVLDISMRCGFNNAANFNRAFRKKTGLTPLQYRKLIQQYGRSF